MRKRVRVQCRERVLGIRMPQVLLKISFSCWMLRVIYLSPVQCIWPRCEEWLLSGSMALRAGSNSSATKWDLAKEVAKTAIDLLHFADAMRLVIVGDEDFERDDDDAVLMGASDTNKVTLKGRLDKASPHGKKRAVDGLETAFHTFRRAQREEIKSTGCQQVSPCDFLIFFSLFCMCQGHFLDHRWPALR